MQTGRIVSHLGLGCAYFLLAAATISLTRFDGGVAYVWIASALLLARLLTLDCADWRGYLAASAFASVLATGLFGLGWAAALPLAAINVGETAFAALCMARGRRIEEAGSLGWLKLFFAASLASAALGSVAVAGVMHGLGRPDANVTAMNWAVGHSMSLITFTPLFAQLFAVRVRAWWADHVSADPWGTAGMLALMAGMTVGAFYQQGLPLLFLPILPLVLVTHRLGQLGATLGVIILIVIGSSATLTGHGPIYLAELDFAGRIHFLQFYLAGSMLTVLPLAAVLSRRDQLYRRLVDSEARYRLLAEQSTDVIASLDLSGNFRFVSPVFERHSGHSPDEVIGKSPLEIIDPAFHGAVRAAHHATLRAGGNTIRVEYLVRTGSGASRWFETHERAVLDECGTPTGVVAVIRDIHDRKANETRLAYEASTDPLTGALNRRALAGAIDNAIKAQICGALVVFDLDHFKEVNDQHGHEAGDATLRAFSDTATGMIRTGDVFARIGGEEFALFLPNATLEQARQISQRLLDRVAGLRIPADQDVIRVTASAGIAELRSTFAETMKRADSALYLAKRAGRDQITLAA